MIENAEPLQDIAHIGHVELLTPKPVESLWYFTDLLGLEVAHAEGQSVYLRGYGDYAATSFKLTEAPAPGIGHVAWRAVSEAALQRRAVAIEATGLGIGWANGDFGHGRCYQFRDPDGHLLVLIEARTFAPGDWQDYRGAICGPLLEYSLMTRSISTATPFWQALGFETVAAGLEPHPWLRLTGFGLSIGLHETAYFEPGPSYRVSDLNTRLAFLAAKNLKPTERRALSAPLHAGVTLLAPERTPIYLFEANAATFPWR